MIGIASLQPLYKPHPVRRITEMKQVRPTMAIRCPETGLWGRAAQVLKQRRPLMLPAHWIRGVPHFGQWRMTAQIINVPVWASDDPGMMRYPRSQSTGTEGAADINAATWRQAQFT
jgi:hypothetical protein